MTVQIETSSGFRAELSTHSKKETKSKENVQYVYSAGSVCIAQAVEGSENLHWENNELNSTSGYWFS